MELVTFGNAGSISPLLWSTFGVSAKETDNAIGQFGTGLKYAIAVLVREGRYIRINSDGVDYVFTSRDIDVRGKEFKQVFCNDTPLPFTTHLGVNWDLWQAYRELYSNCLDEGGSIGVESDTTVYAEIADIDHNEVFLDKANRRLLHSTKYADIYAGSSEYLYLKGVRVQDLTEESSFTYDLKDCYLTEDRTLKYSHEVSRQIGSAISSVDSRDLALHFLMHTKDKFEERIDFDYVHISPSTQMMEITNQFRKDNVWMHESAKAKCIQHLGAAVYEKIDFDERQKKVLDKAAHFCELIGYPITHDVFLVENLGSNTLAMADRDKKEIYLSSRVLTQGVKQVVSTLIEEQIHLSEGLDDCTYNMQSFLFDQIVTMGEKLTGEIL